MNQTVAFKRKKEHEIENKRNTESHLMERIRKYLLPEIALMVLRKTRRA
jgi:hypothetical protein